MAARHLLIAALLLLRAAPAQDAAPATEPTLTTLLQRLRDPALDAPARQALADTILARGPAERTALFDAVRTGHASRREQFGRDLRRHLERCQKEVPAALRARLGRRGSRQLEELRARALAISRDPDLDKQRIHDELDPLRARLEALALVTCQDVLAHDRDLAADDAGLRTRAGDLQDWFQLYLHVMHAVDQDEAGRRHVDRFAQEPDPPDVARDLDAAGDQAVLLGLPLSGRDQKVLQDNVALQARTDPEEFAGTTALNRIRIAFGLPVLALDEKLGNAARDHSHDMLTLGFFAHESPVAGKRTPGDRAARAGTSASAENIAAGQATGVGAITAWWYSPGHHKNMLGGHARTGLGRSGALWTQMFGG